LIKKIAILLGFSIGVALLIFFLPRENEAGAPEVPLGVEHAVTIAYNGPELDVKPYRFGVPVNLRIAGSVKEGQFTIYDVRYLLNAGGEFDITEFLRAKDGSSVDDLPEFKVIGLEKLSQGMDTHIEQVEEMGVQIWHYYYEVMAMVMALWIIWLFLLIFYGHPKKETPVEAEPELPFEERLMEYVKKMEAGSLDDMAKARLEILLLSWWRQKLDLSHKSMSETSRDIKESPECGAAAKLLEKWIHAPASDELSQEVAASLKPFTVCSGDRTL
jgi:hypothetical protein